jgi:hypothetical protein
MEKAAIGKARTRLQKARESLDRAKSSKDFGEFTSAWTDFLTATNNIHSTLRAGAQSNATSRQWVGGKKRIRTQDPLLSYLHQARNADEHGIEPVAELVPASLSISGAEIAKVQRVDRDGNNFNITLHPHIKELPTVTWNPATVKLIPVFDKRFNPTPKFDPPAEHLGNKLLDTSPVGIGELCLAYYSSLIDEAEKLVR